MVPSFASGRSLRGFDGMGASAFSFVPSRGGGVLYPGDSWTVTITGSTPNQAVYGDGGKNLAGCASGYGCTQGYGTTDGTGSFSVTKTIGAGDVGAWGISFAVGNQPAGSISFTVSPEGPTPPPHSVGVEDVLNQAHDAHTPPVAVSLPSSPLVWIGAGLAALYLFKGRGGNA